MGSQGDDQIVSTVVSLWKMSKGLTEQPFETIASHGIASSARHGKAKSMVPAFIGKGVDSDRATMHRLAIRIDQLELGWLSQSL